MFFYQISTLTDEVNTLDHVGNATVKGIIGGGDKAETWGVVDTIAGGTAGSKMDLTAIVGDDTGTTGNVSTIGRSTSGIETFNITFKDANADQRNSLTVDTSSLAGAKNFNIVSATASGGDGVNFTGLAQDQMVTIKSAAAKLNVELGYSEAAAAGKEDVASFSLHNAKANTVTVGAGMEAVKVTATGDNKVALINAADATKFVFDGAGKLDAALNSDVKIAEIDASKATGSLELDVTAVQLDSKAVIKGGTATDDVLGVSGNITSKMTVSGFETVGLNGNDSTFDMINVTGATTVANFSAGSGADHAALTVKNATGVTNLLMEGSGKADAVNANMNIGGITFTAKAAQDKLDVAINNHGVALDKVTDSNADAVIHAGALNITNVKDITINAADAGVKLASLAATKMESLTVKATEDFAITAPVDFKNDTKVDMAGVVGAVTMEFGTIANTPITLTKALTYTGSSAVDTLTFGTLTGKTGGEVAYTIDTGAGNDVVNLAGGIKAAADAVLNLNLGDGDDTLILGGTAITVGQSAGQTIDFGAGNNTLQLAGALDFDLSAAKVTNLDAIKIDQAGTAASHLIINGETANGLTSVYASATGTQLNITLQGAAKTDVTFKNDTLTLTNAKLNITGSADNDNITASEYGDTITGGKGADTIKLGAEDDIVKFSVAADNGRDAIDGFIAGVGGDVLNVKAVDSGFATIPVGGLESLTATGAATVADGSINVVTMTGNVTMKDFGGTDFASLVAGTNTAIKDCAQNTEAFIFVQGDGGSAQLLFLKSTDAAIVGSEITTLGVFTNFSGALNIADFSVA